MYEKLEINEKALALSKELDILKDLSDKKEEELNTNIRELESESSKLRHNLESQMNDNKQLREQVQRAETDFIENKRWNSSSEALNWLNTHHSRNRKGLGFVNRRVTKPVDKKYVGLPENIICYHCGKTGHYRYACSLRKRAIERNPLYVKQI